MSRYRVRFSGSSLLCVTAAGALVALWSTSARATDIQPGRSYQGQIVACESEQDAKSLRGFVIAGELTKARAYLKATNNTCGVGPARFIPEEQIGKTEKDRKGNAWKIVKIELPTAEAFLVTTADFIAGQMT